MTGWPEKNYITLPVDEDVTGMVPMGDKLVVFTANHTFVLRHLRWYEKMWNWFKSSP